MKKYRMNIIFIIGISLVCIGYLLTKSSPKEMLEEFKRVTPIWMGASFLCIGLYWLIEAIIQHLLVEKMHTTHSFWNSFKVTMTGQFFNAITPFSSGGQPMQAFMMTKDGIPVGTAVSILITKFIIYQIILTIYSFIVLLAKIRFFYTHINGLVWLAILGFLVNVAVVILLLSTVFMQTPLKRIAFACVNLLKRMRIIKDTFVIKKKIIFQINLFRKNMQVLKTNWQLLIKVMVLTIGQLTVYFLIPYSVYRAFGLKGTTLFLIVAATAFIVMFSSFMPLPGGSGVAEGSFFLFFQLFFPTTVLPTAILCWRVVTFYVPLCVGGLMTGLPSVGAPNTKQGSAREI